MKVAIRLESSACARVTLVSESQFASFAVASETIDAFNALLEA
jgi:hypothetical protein